MIGNSEPMDNVLDEFSRPLELEVDDGPDLDPLGELVDGDQLVIEDSGSLLEFPGHVEAPDHERPGDENRLERLRS